MLTKIRTLPPLVSASEVGCELCLHKRHGITEQAIFQQIERLRHQLTQVQKNKAFLLHAGDCAESFDACTHVRFLVSLRPSMPHITLQENISNKIGLILSFSLILIWGARMPVVSRCHVQAVRHIHDPCTGPDRANRWTIR